MSLSIASRRSFLRTASATAIAGFGLSHSSAWASLNDTQARPGTGRTDAKIPSRGTLLKFHADGSVRGFAGNTVISHLPAQCAMRDAIVAFHEDLAKGACRRKISLLPQDSLHMTVFSGANDQDRTRTGWPSDVPLTATIDACNSVVGERMKRFHLNCEVPLRMRLDETHTLAYENAGSLRMSPVDEVERTKLKVLRDRLAEVYRFRAADHDRYEFHITVAYQMAAFSDEEDAAYTSVLRLHLPRIAAAAPVLELGPPEFCTFKNMYRFDPQTILRS